MQNRIYVTHALLWVSCNWYFSSKTISLFCQHLWGRQEYWELPHPERPRGCIPTAKILTQPCLCTWTTFSLRTTEYAQNLFFNNQHFVQGLFGCFPNITQSSMAGDLYCKHGHICRFRDCVMGKEFVLDALRSEGHEVKHCDHNKRDGRWQVGNDNFEVHLGYRNNRWSREGTVDTIVRGKQGWKKAGFDLNGVAQILQHAYRNVKHTETGTDSACVPCSTSFTRPASQWNQLSVFLCLSVMSDVASQTWFSWCISINVSHGFTEAY